MQKYSPGYKIKELRKKSGISQLDLEMMLDMAVGSLSRIENGKVNPSKETLYKVVKHFDLSAFQLADLMGIPILDLSLAKKILINNNITLVAQTVVDMMHYDLDYIGGAILLSEGEFLRAIYHTNRKIINKLAKMMAADFSSYRFSIKDSDSFVAKTYRDQQIYQSENAEEFLYPEVERRFLRIMVKTMKIKSMITIPISCDSQNYGVLWITSKYNTFDNYEVGILQSFADYVAIAIRNCTFPIEGKNIFDLTEMKNEFRLQN